MFFEDFPTLTVSFLSFSSLHFPAITLRIRFFVSSTKNVSTLRRLMILRMGPKNPQWCPHPLASVLYEVERMLQHRYVAVHTSRVSLLFRASSRSYKLIQGNVVTLILLLPSNFKFFLLFYICILYFNIAVWSWDIKVSSRWCAVIHYPNSQQPWIQS